MNVSELSALPPSTTLALREARGLSKVSLATAGSRESTVHVRESDGARHVPALGSYAVETVSNRDLFAWTDRDEQRLAASKARREESEAFGAALEAAGLPFRGVTVVGFGQDREIRIQLPKASLADATTILRASHAKHDALCVIALDAKIAAWLSVRDPKALAQVRSALGIEAPVEAPIRPGDAVVCGVCGTTTTAGESVGGGVVAARHFPRESDAYPCGGSGLGRIEKVGAA